MRLEDWFLVSSNDDPYTAPELKKQQVRGRVYGSDKFKEGALIKTSDVVRFEDGKVFTLNSEYELGEVAPDYLEKYPKTNKLRKA